MRVLCLSILLTFTLSVNAEIYRWVDEHGKLHFSDKAPNSDVEAYEPKPILVIPATPGINRSKSPPRSVKKQVKYKDLKVASPVNDAVFTPENSAEIVVTVEVTPYLQQGHQLVIYLDSQLYLKGRQRVLVLNNLDRGTHTIRATIINEKGKLLKSSENVSFHVQKFHL